MIDEHSGTCLSVLKSAMIMLPASVFGVVAQEHQSCINELCVSQLPLDNQRHSATRPFFQSGIRKIRVCSTSCPCRENFQALPWIDPRIIRITPLAVPSSTTPSPRLWSSPTAAWHTAATRRNSCHISSSWGFRYVNDPFQRACGLGGASLVLNTSIIAKTCKNYPLNVNQSRCVWIVF